MEIVKQFQTDVTNNFARAILIARIYDSAVVRLKLNSAIQIKFNRGRKRALRNWWLRLVCRLILINPRSNLSTGQIPGDSQSTEYISGFHSPISSTAKSFRATRRASWFTWLTRFVCIPRYLGLAKFRTIEKSNYELEERILRCVQGWVGSEN